MSACILEQQCVHRLEQLPFFTFKDFLLADDERYAAVIHCECLCTVKAFAKLCFWYVLVLYQGVLNMGTLHNGFKCLAGKNGLDTGAKLALLAKV